MYCGFSDHRFVFLLLSRVVYLLFLNMCPVTIFSPMLRLKGFYEARAANLTLFTYLSQSSSTGSAREVWPQFGHTVPVFPGNHHDNQEHPTVLDYI